MKAPTHVIGDIHGYRDTLTHLLDYSGLVRAGHWSGGEARLLFMGDIFNRGPDGLGVLELIMRLQCEAERAGGWVDMLLGNHDLLLLAALHFGETFLDYWSDNGGVTHDLAGITPEQVAWLSVRPAMLLLGEGNSQVLYQHADATFYETLGKRVEDVNSTLKGIMQGRNWGAWHALTEVFSEHEAFWQRGGKVKAKRFLGQFGGVRLVHAHTPISKLTRQPDSSVTGPLTYADGLCTDVDHALYRGGSGFIYQP